MKSIINESIAIRLYNEGKTSTEIGEYFGASKESVVKFLRRRNYRFSKRKYEFNDSFFNEIDTESKAYYLGFLYADGNITNKHRKQSIRLEIHKQDFHILEDFKSVLNYSKPIYFYNNKNMCGLELTGRNIVDGALKHGLVPAKTFKLTFPNFIKKELLHHFIRGYFDGDGGLCFTIPKRSLRKTFILSFTGTNVFCQSVQDILSEQLNVKSKFYIRHPERNNCIGSFSIGGNHQVQKILDYLYKDANFYLKRKHSLYEELCKINLL